MSPVEQQLQFEMHQCRSAFLYVNSSVLKKKEKNKTKTHRPFTFNQVCVGVHGRPGFIWYICAEQKSLSFKTFNRSFASSQTLDGRLLSLSLSLLISIAPESSLLCSFEDGNEGFDYYGKKSLFSFSSSFHDCLCARGKKTNFCIPTSPPPSLLVFGFQVEGRHLLQRLQEGRGVHGGLRQGQGRGWGSPPGGQDQRWWRRWR